MQILLLVIGMIGVAALLVCLGDGTTTSVGVGMLVWCAVRWWDTRNDGRVRNAGNRTREDEILIVVGLSLATGLFALSALDGGAEDQLWTSCVKTAAALATATLAATGVSRLRRDDMRRP